jgi:hypothetical protein
VFPSILALSLLGWFPEGDADEHWAFQARRNVATPTFADAAGRDWVRNPIDAFVLGQLRKAGLKPAAEAERGVLIRRLTFDLTGLPPTPEDVAAFVGDKSPNAYERLVERLLASPRYGEKWGRHWLDVVRFSESEGFEYDRMRPGAWRYRDYVIDAFNDDKPLNRFIMEQIAGDEIAPDDRTSLVAAGFHRLGPVRRNAGNKDIAMSRNEILTEMTDAIGSSFLGLTVGCARCHDHRFDAIPLRDYYHLQAFMAATQEHDIVTVTPEEQAVWKKKNDKIRSQIKRLLGQQDRTADASEAATLQTQIDELSSTLPEPLDTISTVRNDWKDRTTVHVLKRGDPDRKGDALGPRVLTVLPSRQTTSELPADFTAPRTQLARWVADADNPLTARVWVNRVWQNHFGRGLVATANDFGNNGARPSHPELLDFLANAFIQGGERTKPLHRMIVLSSAYRQSSVAADTALSKKVDPDNRLVSRFPRRRLSAEEVRDAMLAASGSLNLRVGGPSVLLPVAGDLVKQLYDPSQWQVTPDKREHNRRSVYLIAKRNLQLPFFQVFDQPPLQVSCPRREASTHALQSLELLNGATSNQLAEDFAARLQRECGSDRGKFVERAFLLAAGRIPSVAEHALGRDFLARHSTKEFALAMFNLNVFIYVD